MAEEILLMTDLVWDILMNSMATLRQHLHLELACKFQRSLEISLHHQTLRLHFPKAPLCRLNSGVQQHHWRLGEASSPAPAPSKVHSLTSITCFLNWHFFLGIWSHYLSRVAEGLGYASWGFAPGSAMVAGLAKLDTRKHQNFLFALIITLLRHFVNQLLWILPWQ